MSAAPAMGPVAGVLLAGGGARRMGGGDKGLRLLGGETILARIVARAAPQVDRLILNANGEAARFADLDLPVVADSVAGGVGPLAGVLTGLEWVQANMPGCVWLASFAGDAPFVPENLVEKLAAAIAESGAEMACAASAGRAHPVFGLWPVKLAADLRHALADEGIRKVDAWTARYRMATVDFPVAKADPFFNVNRLEDLASAERLIQDN